MPVSIQSGAGNWCTFLYCSICSCLLETDRTAPLARLWRFSTVGQRTKRCTRPISIGVAMVFDGYFTAAVGLKKNHVVHRSKSPLDSRLAVAILSHRGASITSLVGAVMERSWCRIRSWIWLSTPSSPTFAQLQPWMIVFVVHQSMPAIP